MNFEIITTCRRRTIMMFFLYFLAFALAGLLLVWLSRGNPTVITLAAFLFFLGPWGLIYLNRPKFFFPVNLRVTDHSLVIAGPAGERKIDWSSVQTWQVETTQSLQGTGYIIRFRTIDGKQTFTFYEPLFEGGQFRNDSALYAIARSIGRYNRITPNGPITFKPNFLATSTGTVVVTVLGILIWGDLLLRYTQGKVSGRVPATGLIVVVLIVAVSIFDRKKKGDLLFRQLQALQE